jgi:hypothetical protein
MKAGPRTAPRPRTFRITRALKASPFPRSFQRTSYCLQRLAETNPSLVRRLERHLGEYPDAGRELERSFDTFADRASKNGMLMWELELMLENHIAVGNAYPGQGWRSVQAEDDLSDAEHYAAVYLYRSASFLLSHGKVALIADRIARARLFPDAANAKHSRHRRALAKRIRSLIAVAP